ncbi:DUF899 family protein [Ottowia sp.]|uniref:DUF899 family protein n=1 Tax=Ottowia sp. TaxID=1898956 RepID=UPI0039648088|nr:DUF899 family protein [Pseudomonadota bacterium]
MWKHGAPHDKQSPGCTHTQVALNEHVRADLAARDVRYAVFCVRPWDDIAAGRDFLGWTTPYSTTDAASALRGVKTQVLDRAARLHRAGRGYRGQRHRPAFDAMTGAIATQHGASCTTPVSAIACSCRPRGQ